MKTVKQWHGLKALVHDAVEHGSIAIERLQKQTADRPFAILESIPSIAGVARSVHVIHDAAVSGVHGAIRLVNRGVSAALDIALDSVGGERSDETARHDDGSDPSG